MYWLSVSSESGDMQSWSSWPPQHLKRREYLEEDPVDSLSVFKKFTGKWQRQSYGFKQDSDGDPATGTGLSKKKSLEKGRELTFL